MVPADRQAVRALLRRLTLDSPVPAARPHPGHSGRVARQTPLSTGSLQQEASSGHSERVCSSQQSHSSAKQPTAEADLAVRGVGWRAVDVAAELLLGAACPGCSAAGFGLCVGCRMRLAEPTPHRTRPMPEPAGFPETVTAGPYDDLLHALIPAHKEHQAWLLSRPLGNRLARAIELLIMNDSTGVEHEPLVLIPVPSTRAAIRSRGRDATAAIATAAARRLRRDRRLAVTVLSALRPVRRVADQSELSESERRSNLRGAYAVRTRPPAGSELILVDDLVTTGSSLTEAARALRVAGASVRGAAVVAATVRQQVPQSQRRQPG